MKLNQDALCNPRKKLITVATRNVVSTLSEEEITQTFHQIFEKMKVFDPNNPNLWVVKNQRAQAMGNS